jgi:glycosyltransferase involved in cell wall biosynthesis
VDAFRGHRRLEPIQLHVELPAGGRRRGHLGVFLQGTYHEAKNPCDPATFARKVVGAHISQKVTFSAVEIDFLLRYEKDLILGDPKTAPWIEAIVGSHDIVTCEYPMHAPLLSDFCKRLVKPLVVTSHDVLYELHGTSPEAKQLLKQKEIQALRLAQGLVFCTETERRKFAGFGLKGVTVLNTGDARGITPGREGPSREAVRAELKIATPQFCLFVGSAHGPNLAAVGDLREMAKAMPEMTFVVAGNCAPKTVEQNFLATGPVSEQALDALYRGAFAVLVPLARGTGMSVKVFQAMAYGKAVISTPVGARGHTVTDGTELLIVPTPSAFPGAIRSLLADEQARTQLEKEARGYAIGLDYRTHFQPYGDLITQLLRRPRATEPKERRSLVLVDNNLSDRIGHHFNYTLALKEQCCALGEQFQALVNNAAGADVLAEISACGTFSSGIHDEVSSNPYPEEWANLRSVYDFLRSNDHFARELEAGLAAKARPGDLVFIPNATPRQMLGLALLLHRNPIYRTLEFVLILRYSVFVPSGPPGQRQIVRDKENAERYALAIERLYGNDPNGMVRLATDSAELAKEFGTMSRRPIEVLPIPHTTHPLPPSLPAGVPAKDPRKLRVVYLGDARDEKGFAFLPAVARAFSEAQFLSKVEFVFQAFVSSKYHEAMNPAIDEMLRAKQPNVHLVQSSLTADAYQALLQSADVVLLPYDALTYRARTSGPFVEAICANKPVVVPADSWMSLQLAKSDAGTSFTSGNVQSLVQAVRSVLGNYQRHAAAAGQLGTQFREYHNPRTFVQRLMRTG